MFSLLCLSALFLCRANGTAVAALLQAAGQALSAGGFLYFFLFFFFLRCYLSPLQLAENAAFVVGGGGRNVTHDTLPKGTGDVVGTVGSQRWAGLLSPGDTAVSQPLVQQHGHSRRNSSQLREGSEAAAGNTLQHFFRI